MRIQDILRDGRWDWNCLSFEMLKSIKDIIYATPYALASEKGDSLAWVGSPQGNFDLKNAYKLAMKEELAKDFLNKWIWRVNVLPRI